MHTYTYTHAHPDTYIRTSLTSVPRTIQLTSLPQEHPDLRTTDPAYHQRLNRARSLGKLPAGIYMDIYMSIYLPPCPIPPKQTNINPPFSPSPSPSPAPRQMTIGCWVRPDPSLNLLQSDEPPKYVQRETYQNTYRPTSCSYSTNTNVSHQSRLLSPRAAEVLTSLWRVYVCVNLKLSHRNSCHMPYNLPMTFPPTGISLAPACHTTTSQAHASASDGGHPPPTSPTHLHPNMSTSPTVAGQTQRVPHTRQARIRVAGYGRHFVNRGRRTRKETGRAATVFLWGQEGRRNSRR